ncbi:MAG: phospholipase D-like domain-containing protein [Candidatus Sericytochromatia bacterium]
MCNLVNKTLGIPYLPEKNYSLKTTKTNNICIEPPLICSDEINISTKQNKSTFAKPKLSFNKSDNKTELAKKNAYYDNEKQICVDPKNLIDKSKNHVDISKFTLDKSNSDVLIDMSLEVKDKNGFNNTLKNDIQGKIKNGEININHDLFDKALYSMKGVKTQDGQRTTEIKNVSFDKKDKSYTFDIKVTQNISKIGLPLAWDNFKVKFKTDSNGKLSAKVEDNWIFDSMIVDKLENIIKDKVKSNIPEKYRSININVQKNKNELILTPEIKNLSVPIAENKEFNIEHIEGEKAKFKIDESGSININLKDVGIKGSSGKEESKVSENNPDEAEIDLKIGIGKNKEKQVYAKGKLGINVDEKETASIKIGKENLGSYLKSTKILNDFSVYVKQDTQNKLEVESKNHVYLQDTKVNATDRVVNMSTNLSLKFDKDNGINLEVIEETDNKELNLKTSLNGVETIVGGHNFYNHIQNRIKEAKESINLETFELKDDSTSNAISYNLIKRAAGLNPEENKISISKQNSKGLDVKIIFNSWQGIKEEGEHTEKMLERNINKIKTEINTSSLTKSQKEQAINNIDKNFKYKFFTDGLLRSDHRKAFIVDGKTASVGGININDFHLGKDSAHDIMLDIAGPEVRNVQKEFLENWFEFNNLKQPDESTWNQLLKSESDLNKNLNQLQKNGKYKSQSNVGVLVTDDHQTDISKGILKLIDDSKKEIFIEQAFFTDTKINEKLKEAMRRGVDVNVIVSKDSLSAHIFNDGNLYSTYQLLKEHKNGATGNVKLFLYEDNEGYFRKHIHTKAISADGNKAIVGSANMVGRSLDSPFQLINEDGSKQNIMYNKEMSLYLDGESAVKNIDDSLFKNDIKTKTKEISHQEIEEMVKKAGGEEAIKKKFLMAIVT